MISELSRSPRSFNELKSLIQAENLSVKSQITSELQQHQRHLAHDQYRLRFLENLYFPEIHRRQETVGEAHQKTFEWIYEPVGFDKLAHRWDSIVQWFEQGSGVYWIGGKAGSGKSTLMSYICQDDRTLNLLRAWSGMKEVFTPSFFLCNAGTMLEKSIEGLLRSLLYQILQRFPGLTPLTYDNQSDSDHEPTGQQELRPVAAWTERRLRTTLRNVMLQACEKCRFCIFIDGLDETSDDPDAVIVVIRDLLSANAKICVSSRPDRSYSDAFDSYAKLRLQDLTEPDIKAYLQDELRPFLGTESADRHHVSAILYNIADKAQGVFLWVKLVVKALIRGLRSHDSLEQLRTRVESMPSDIEALYAQMLSKIEVAHRKEAALLFQMAIHFWKTSLLDITFVLCREIYHIPIVSGQKALFFSLQTRERVPTVGAGLLEVILEDKDFAKHSVVGDLKSYDPIIILPLRFAYSSEMADLTYYERHARIDFIHRTAIDFLSQSKEGRDFMEEYTTFNPSPRSSYVRALLAKVDLLGLPKKPAIVDASYSETGGVRVDTHAGDDFDDVREHAARHLVLAIMFEISKKEWETDTSLTPLCDDIDRTFTSVYHRHRMILPPVHWVTRVDLFSVLTPESTLVARRSDKSSGSSSPGSFQSARSEPTIFSNKPVDFIGFAASWGLCRYVLEVVDLQQSDLDQSYIDYLLWCSTCVFSRYMGYISHNGSALISLKLTEGLLIRGGNPNAYVEGVSTTIWGAVLDNWARTDAEKALIATALAFLNAGADVHSRIRTPFHIRCSDLDLGLDMSDSTPIVLLYSELSALNLVRRLSKRIPEWNLVEEIILAKGGCDFHTYTFGSVYSKTRGQTYMIPEFQQENLVAALNEYFDIHPYHGEKSISWVHGMQKICKHHLPNIGDTGIQISPDDVVSSDADAEEEYYDAHDIRPVEDAQNTHHME